MIERLKEISLYLVSSALLVGMSHALNSQFLRGYLGENLITLLIALLAINTTTSSVVMTKLKELSDQKEGNFGNTIRELKHSIVEQVLLVIIAVVLLILGSSAEFLAMWQWNAIAIELLLTSLFVAALHALFDTANAIFVILHFEDNKKKDD
jgi:cobalamin synthase